MYRLRTDIVYLFSTLLIAGLLMSALHIHEVKDRHTSADPDTGHTVEQDHLFCPFCTVVFEGIVAECESAETTLQSRDELPAAEQQTVTTFHFASKSGRSPPLG